MVALWRRPIASTASHNKVVGIRRPRRLRRLYTYYLIQRLFFVLALCIFLHAPAPACGCGCGLPAAPVDHPHPYAPAPVRTRGFSGLKILRVRVHPHAGAGGTRTRRLPCRPMAGPPKTPLSRVAARTQDQIYEEFWVACPFGTQHRRLCTAFNQWVGYPTVVGSPR